MNMLETVETVLDASHTVLDALAARECSPMLIVVCGSHAYGTSTPESDVDVRGVFVPPWKALVGLDDIGTLSCEPDAVMHSARKFVGLCAGGNPNILDWLFVPDDCVTYMSNEFRRIVWSRRPM